MRRSEHGQYGIEDSLMYRIPISSWLLDHSKISYNVLGDGKNELRTYYAPSHTALRSMRIRNESRLVFIFSGHPSQ